MEIEAPKTSCAKTFSGGAHLFDRDQQDSYRRGGAGSSTTRDRPAAGLSFKQTVNAVSTPLVGFYCPMVLSASPSISATFDAPALTWTRSVSFNVSLASCSSFRDR